MTHTPDAITYSHLVADSEKIRTKARRAAKEIERIMPDLEHAIKHGRIVAAADMLRTLDRYNLTILDATAPPAR